MFRGSLIRAIRPARLLLREKNIASQCAVSAPVSQVNRIRLISNQGGKGDHPKADNEQVTDDGFNIFEQLKSKKQQSKQGSSGEENPENLDPKEEERIRRRQESAEKEINERQKKTFGRGTLFLGLSAIGIYAYLGIF